MSDANKEEVAVVVTTEFRGVFFGYATNVDGDTIHLRSCRNCISWPVETKGFLGLAAQGPTKGCRVGPAADFQVRKVTGVARCTPEAVKAWEAAPWTR